MNVVLPVCRKDIAAAVRNLQWCLKLSPATRPFVCYVSHEKGLDVKPVISLCSQVFRGVREIIYPPYHGSPTWPQPHNYAFKYAVLHMLKDGTRSPWLWWEQDAVPLLPDSFEKLWSEYQIQKKPILGTRGASDQFEPASHVMGVAVYPWDAGRYCQKWLRPSPLPFDVAGGREMMSVAALTPLIQHVWCWDKYSAPSVAPVFTTPDDLRKIDAEAAFFHRCKDSSLIDQLQRRDYAPPLDIDNLPTYYHSGALGDIIYALFAIKKAYGGNLSVGAEQLSTAPPREVITHKAFEFLRPLVYQQPYIDQFSYCDTYPGGVIDMNQFRNQWGDSRIRASTGISLLAHMHFHTIGLGQYFDHAEQWLYVVDPIVTKKFIINRTPRYQNRAFKWPKIIELLGRDNLLFVGLKPEYDQFCSEFGKVEHQPIKDALHLAELIAGSEGFIGNQSFPCSIAIGLGQRVIQETAAISPDCLFKRRNLIGYETGGFLNKKTVEHWKTSELSHLDEPHVLTEIQNPPFISIVTYNRLDMTKRCLALLDKHTSSYRLVITDNASSDGTPAFLADFAAKRPHVTYMQNTANEGFQNPNAAAFKIACESSPRPTHFVLLNNDVEVGAGWWQRVEAGFSSDPKLAIIGSSRGVCGKLSADFHGRPIGPTEAPEYVEGSLMAMKLSAIEPLGLFDKNLLFMYGEDSDLSLRVREAGHKITTIDMNCHHLVNQSMRVVDPATKRKIKKHQDDNHAYLRKRWRVYLARKSFDYSVLINRRGALGDVIDVTAVIRQMTKRWPFAKISISTDCPDVFSQNPDVKIAAREVRGEFDYSYNLDLAYENHPDEHTLTAYCRVCDDLKCDLDSMRPVMCTSLKDEEFAKSVMPSKAVAIHAAPSWPGKTWPLERWHALIEILRSEGYIPVFVGSDAPWDLGVGVDIRGKTSPSALAAVMDRCSLFVGIDSGPSHIAQAVNIPSVVLFGTVLAERKLFPACNVIGVQGDVKSTPCIGLHHRLPPPVTHSTCDGACMRAITVDMVQSAIKDVL